MRLYNFLFSRKNTKKNICHSRVGAPTLGLGGPSPQSAIFLYAFHHKQFLRSLRWEFNKILPRVIVVVKICKVVTYIFFF